MEKPQSLAGIFVVRENMIRVIYYLEGLCIIFFFYTSGQGGEITLKQIFSQAFPKPLPAQSQAGANQVHPLETSSLLGLVLFEIAAYQLRIQGIIFSFINCRRITKYRGGFAPAPLSVHTLPT